MAVARGESVLGRSIDEASQLVADLLLPWLVDARTAIALAADRETLALGALGGAAALVFVAATAALVGVAVLFVPPEELRPLLHR